MYEGAEIGRQPADARHHAIFYGFVEITPFNRPSSGIFYRMSFFEHCAIMIR